MRVDSQSLHAVFLLVMSSFCLKRRNIVWKWRENTPLLALLVGIILHRDILNQGVSVPFSCRNIRINVGWESVAVTGTRFQTVSRPIIPGLFVRITFGLFFRNTSGLFFQIRSGLFFRITSRLFARITGGNFYNWHLMCGGCLGLWLYNLDWGGFEKTFFADGVWDFFQLEKRLKSKLNPLSQNKYSGDFKWGRMSWFTNGIKKPTIGV